MVVYDFEVKDAQGDTVSLDKYKGKVLLIVNTATKCGFTPQYKGLEDLYAKYRDQGLEILDFPCNQFLNQAPEDIDEIDRFCVLKYGTEFPRFAKIDVNGEDADPLYVWLKESLPKDATNSKTKDFLNAVAGYTQGLEPNDIHWNFTKFLIDRKGNPVARFAPTVTPEELEGAIEAQLA